MTNIESFEIIQNKFTHLQLNIEYLCDLLASRLDAYDVYYSKDDTLIELIERIDNINATEKYYENNTKPINNITLDSYDNILEYLGNLYKYITYCRKLLIYYLILKNVSIDKVLNTNTLKELILLVSNIVEKKKSYLSIFNESLNTHIYTKTEIQYTLVDDNQQNIQEGIIKLLLNNTEITSINAGDALFLTPNLDTTEPVNLKIIYCGTDNYLMNEYTDTIMIQPSNIVLDVHVKNINNDSSYYNSNYTGYQNDTFEINITTYNIQGYYIPNVPLTITINNTLYTYVTDDNGTCIINKSINQIGLQSIIIDTNHDYHQLSNVHAEYFITIYYPPLYQLQSEYIDYYGQDKYQYEIIRRNIYNGQDCNDMCDGEDIKISYDGISKYLTVKDGKAIIEFSSLSCGIHILTWDFNGTRIYTTIKILSHFILPNKKTFFYPDTPDIYYVPYHTNEYNTDEWNDISKINKQVLITSYYYDTDDDNQIQYLDNNQVIYTNQYGILHRINDYTDIHTYTLSLTANSDNLNEHIYYTYQIVKPFDIQLIKQTDFFVEYNIHIYDINNYNMGDYYNKNIISFNYNIRDVCIITEKNYDTYYDINLIIPSRNATSGKPIELLVNFNNYCETVTFELPIINITYVSDIEVDYDGNLIITELNDNPMGQEILSKITLTDNHNLQIDKDIVNDIFDVIINVNIDNNDNIVYQYYGDDIYE